MHFSEQHCKLARVACIYTIAVIIIPQLCITVIRYYSLIQLLTLDCCTCFKVLRFFDTAKIQWYPNSFLSVNVNALYRIGLQRFTPE